MTINKITEGEAIILAEDVDVASREQEVFYNKEMELNRSVTIALLRKLPNTHMKVALPLAGSGVRALRLLLELPPEKIEIVKANDMKEKAVSRMRENLKLNTIDENKMIISHEDGNVFLQAEAGFDYIDVDPFGSPNIVLNETVAHARKGGIIAITATDTAALAGTYPQACKQKYQAVSAPMPQRHEMGLRILARKAIMTGMHYTKRLTPILSYHEKHYYRIFFKVEKGKQKAASAYEHINSHYHHCPHCGFHETSNGAKKKCPHCQGEFSWAGPLYDGPLQDKAMVTMLEEETKENKRLTRLFAKLKEEARLDIPGFYDTHQLAQQLETPLKKVKDITAKLEKKGYKAVQTATVPEGIKTDAPYEDVKEVMREKK
ncbi:MAG: hypothetical protein ACLFTH_03035 [Candidatus Woesearchaeota archaeon]